MTGWTSDELAKIGTVQELGLAAARRHVGQAGDYLARPRGRRPLVRSIYGRTGGWFPATQVLHQGHIRAGGVDKEVTFEPVIPYSPLMRG